MTDAYNFLASWQLFPERGIYEFGSRPKSGVYRIEFGQNAKELKISNNWVTLEDQAFAFQYTVIPNGEEQEFKNKEIAEGIKAMFINTTRFEVLFYKGGQPVMDVIHTITPKGYLQVTQKRFQSEVLSKEEIYHKQLSVLPYSASVSGAVIKPNEEGIIRHHALTAMEEQTNMQLMQIRQQIELLAIQAKEIQQRKELSMIIYNAKLSFNPVIGQVYYLYEKDDGTHLVSMVGPKEWGAKIPFKGYIAAVKLLADHTWSEV